VIKLIVQRQRGRIDRQQLLDRPFHRSKTTPTLRQFPARKPLSNRPIPLIWFGLPCVQSLPKSQSAGAPAATA
jgi:hypothetical protein